MAADMVAKSVVLIISPLCTVTPWTAEISRIKTLSYTSKRRLKVGRNVCLSKTFAPKNSSRRSTGGELEDKVVTNACRRARVSNLASPSLPRPFVFRVDKPHGGTEQRLF